MMKGKQISSLRELHHDGVREPVRVVILGELGAEAPGLDTDHGIKLRIEIGGSAKHFGRNLELFDWGARMIHGMLSQIAEQFAKGLRAMQSAAADKPVNLPEKKLLFAHSIP